MTGCGRSRFGWSHAGGMQGKWRPIEPHPTEGNTAVIAGMIASITGGDVFEIRVAEDQYPSGSTELTRFAQQEKKESARPALAGVVDGFDGYDTLFL